LAAPPPAYRFAHGPAFEAPRAMPVPQVASPPLAPASPLQESVSGYAPPRTVEQFVRDMHDAGDSGRVAVIGTVRDVGTTYRAITLPRPVAQHANVRLADIAV